jgi:plastocyanin
MKRTITFFLFILATANASLSATHTITNSGFTFSPSAITINVGDTVHFVLASIHSAREVDQATWNAGGTTSNGGFDLPLGGGTAVLTQAGTHYYVCVPHASIGMKGTITVNSATGVKFMNKTTPESFLLMQNYPDPFNPSTTIRYGLPDRSNVRIVILNTLGQQIAVLADGEQESGLHEVEWHAAAASGIYFYRIDAVSTKDPNSRFLEVKKMLLLK